MNKGGMETLLGGINPLNKEINPNSNDFDLELLVQPALPEGMLRTAYQSIVNHARHEIMGYEALSRPLSHGARLHPAAWFHAAYQSGLAVDADICALVSAVSQLRTFPLDSGPRRLFVNVMPYSLTQRVFFDKFARVLEAFACQPQTLVVEIVEYTPGDSLSLANAACELRSLGVQIAVDDVRTLDDRLRSLMETVEPNFVKLDRACIQNLSRSPEKTIELSKIVEYVGKQALLIAEGVEHADDLRAVQELGIEYSQGYIWGYPEMNGTMVHLRSQVEILRYALIELVRRNRGCLTAEAVLQKSRELDELLMEYHFEVTRTCVSAQECG